MDDNPRREVGSRLRWTIGSLLAVVAAAALVLALARPLVRQAPPSGEVIGISFDLQETRSRDGRPILGFAPRMTTSKQVGQAPAARP
jgi:hypothetical protein